MIMKTIGISLAVIHYSLFNSYLFVRPLY